MQIKDNKVLLLQTKHPELIIDSIEGSAVVAQSGDRYRVAVPWELPEVQALVGLARFKSIPSPMARDYTYASKLKPYDHQIITSEFLTINKKAFCFNEQGCGKTASVIWAADYLMKLGVIKRVLVICPLSIMKSAWQQDLFKFAMHRSCAVAHGTSVTRAKIINSGAEFVIINFDGVSVVKEEIMAGGFDIIVADEANAYKNAQTNRWRTLRDIMKTTEWLWMLTGTPAAQSPVDAYGLAKLVNPENTPRTFGQYRDSVMYKVTQFKWLPKKNSENTVHNVLQPAIRFEKANCLDLPPVTHVNREAPMTKQQKSYYMLLKKELLFEAAGESVSAINAAAKINKLLQIAGGAVYTETGEVIEFDVKHRLRVVQEVIEEASHKVLVFVPFTHTIELLHEFLTKAKISAEIINGKVSLNKRSKIFDDFQTTADPKVLIIQPRAAAHGLTLTAADTIIWYAPVTSVETYLQANARIDRPGQEHPMTVIHIRGSSVEDKLYAMLQNKIGTHKKIIDLYRDIINEDI